VNFNSPELGTNPPTSSFVPHSTDIIGLFEAFARYWDGVESDCLGEANEEETALELAVLWKGSLKGVLMIRCCRNFFRWMKVNHLGMGLLENLTTLYSVYPIHHDWSFEKFSLGPLLKQPSGPEDWPTQEPDVICRLRAGGFTPEIRLWMDIKTPLAA